MAMNLKAILLSAVITTANFTFAAEKANETRVEKTIKIPVAQKYVASGITTLAIYEAMEKHIRLSYVADANGKKLGGSVDGRSGNIEFSNENDVTKSGDHTVIADSEGGLRIEGTSVHYWVKAKRFKEFPLDLITSGEGDYQISYDKGKISVKFIGKGQKSEESFFSGVGKGLMTRVLNNGKSLDQTKDEVAVQVVEGCLNGVKSSLTKAFKN